MMIKRIIRIGNGLNRINKIGRMKLTEIDSEETLIILLFLLTNIYFYYNSKLNYIEIIFTE